MTTPPDEPERSEDEFTDTIREKARRRQRAQRQSHDIWFGLGTFGMVGWSVTVPTVLGVLIGTWLDANVPVDFSWRLTLLVGGVVLGCLNAWYWVSKERQRTQEERERNEHG